MAETAAAAARREYQREWARKNPDKVRQYQRKWARNNPDKVKAAQERYWARKAETAAQEAQESHGTGN